MSTAASIPARAPNVNSGEIYDPVANTWTPVATDPLPVAIANESNNPALNAFGDDPSMLLPNGNILTGYIAGPQTEIYNPTTNSWSAGGTKLNNDQSDEETWVKLPNGKILSYEIFVNTGQATRRRGALQSRNE